MTSSRSAGASRVVSTVLPALTVVLGLVLVLYMITVEGEPGALPLLLTAGGLVWWVAARMRRGRT